MTIIIAGFKSVFLITQGYGEAATLTSPVNLSIRRRDTLTIKATPAGLSVHTRRTLKIRDKRHV